MVEQRMFNAYVGVDYSGAAKPEVITPGLKMLRYEGDKPPDPKTSGIYDRWSRKSLAERLERLLSTDSRTIVGIDHAFSFPKESLESRHLRYWDDFLEHFTEIWRTDRYSVKDARARTRVWGGPKQLRLTDRWTSSAKSVFRFDIPGQVAGATHAGIPWLLQIRRRLGRRVHFWPFDGFDVPESKSVIAEVYPSLFKNRYPRLDQNSHAADAGAVCQWLQDRDGLGLLAQYFAPRLSQSELDTARLEGWILGVK
jgi:hypothetical protein